MGTARTFPTESGMTSPTGEGKRLSKSSCASPGTRWQQRATQVRPGLPPLLCLELWSGAGWQSLGLTAAPHQHCTHFAYSNAVTQALPLTSPPLLSSPAVLEECTRSRTCAQHSPCASIKPSLVLAQRFQVVLTGGTCSRRWDGTAGRERTAAVTLSRPLCAIKPPHAKPTHAPTGTQNTLQKKRFCPPRALC